MSKLVTRATTSGRSGERGFYFVQRIGLKRALKFLDFDTGRTAAIMTLDKPWGIFALSVSPDRRFVLYSQIYSAHTICS
jgi:hypothetical protein